MNPELTVKADIKYNPYRYPAQPAKGKCRGCGADVPKGRATWCSKKCYETFEPSNVRHRCKQRDKGVCCICGVSTLKAKQRFDHARFWQPPNQYRFLRAGVFDRDAYERALAIAKRHVGKWWAAAEKRRAAMVKAGWPSLGGRSWWDMDHIIPFSEGGLTVLENVRTLCVPCHKARTKEWHKAKSQVPKSEALLL